MNTCTWIDSLRKPKIFGMPIFDWVLTLSAIYLLTWFIYPFFDQYNYYFIFLFIGILVIILGIVIHKLLGINTMLGFYLGLNIYPPRIKCI